jgi:hypothetical protein
MPERAGRAHERERAARVRLVHVQALRVPLRGAGKDVARGHTRAQARERVMRRAEQRSRVFVIDLAIVAAAFAVVVRAHRARQPLGRRRDAPREQPRQPGASRVSVARPRLFAAATGGSSPGTSARWSARRRRSGHNASAFASCTGGQHARADVCWAGTYEKEEHLLRVHKLERIEAQRAARARLELRPRRRAERAESHERAEGPCKRERRRVVEPERLGQRERAKARADCGRSRGGERERSRECAQREERASSAGSTPHREERARLSGARGSRARRRARVCPHPRHRPR